MNEPKAKILVVLVGASGNIGRILGHRLAREPQMRLVTCGRKHVPGEFSHIPWAFGSAFPVEVIYGYGYGCENTFIINASIAWPTNSKDVELSLSALDKICGGIGYKNRLIHISSMSAASTSFTFYATLKREEERMVLASHQVIIRVGIVDSEPPFGLKSLLLKLARLLKFVPVPFSDAKVKITTSEDIVRDVFSVILSPAPGQYIHECCSWEGDFYEAIRKLLPDTRLFKLNNYLCLSVAVVVRFVAKGSSLSQRIDGILALRDKGSHK
jgi:uncharacterized protein YbjT (DUF2867 family)